MLIGAIERPCRVLGSVLQDDADAGVPPAQVGGPRQGSTRTGSPRWGVSRPRALRSRCPAVAASARSAWARATESHCARDSTVAGVSITTPLSQRARATASAVVVDARVINRSSGPAPKKARHTVAPVMSASVSATNETLDGCHTMSSPTIAITTDVRRVDAQRHRPESESGKESRRGPRNKEAHADHQRARTEVFPTISNGEVECGSTDDHHGPSGSLHGADAPARTAPP